jgi:hypothetical protein
MPEDDKNIKDFGEEKQEEDLDPKVVIGDVTPKDLLKLANKILLAAAGIYLIIAILYIILMKDGVKEVWDYSKVLLNSIVSLVIGFYFGKRT